MKRSLFVCSLLCLILGGLAGGLLPMPWDEPSVPSTPALMHTIPSDTSSQSVSTQTDSSDAAFNTSDNFPLLNAACTVVRALRQKDYSTVASFVHPDRGVTFTPYSTVNPESDLAFSREQIMNLTQNTAVYTWGSVDGHGGPIEMTIEQYFERYVFNADYSQAPRIGVDQVMMHGNALENLADSYPQGRFVDFCFPQLTQKGDGLDWCSLKLVFEPGDSNWLLVGVVHGEWTI